MAKFRGLCIPTKVAFAPALKSLCVSRTTTEGALLIALLACETCRHENIDSHPLLPHAIYRRSEIQALEPQPAIRRQPDYNSEPGAGDGNEVH